ncbi:unnamed protein product [Symbiodinium necroappetens]|uniref:Uncharacterized protein n=1 Tax=Symbiodinium necroappetens TaxID=1628268 RepID=A0A813CER5_9DINO|nr:unnamed protein product [Symbiodinium necroappetens]
MFREVRKYLTLKVVMLPCAGTADALAGVWYSRYAVGYMLHFILGHFVPIEDNERAEGCNVVSSLFSDLGRFLCFVLVVSISMKVDNASSVMYDWEAAFWPCWGLEGVIALVVLLVLPACMLSTFADRRKLMMLTWVVFSGLGLGAVSFVSMYNIAFILDNELCSKPPFTPSSGSVRCSQKLQLSIWPWLIFLPSFAIATTLAKVTVYGACFCCFNGLNLENVEIGCAAKETLLCLEWDFCLKSNTEKLRCFCLDIRLVPVTVCIKQQGQMCCLVSAAAIPPDAEVPMMLSVCFLVCFPKFGFFKKISEVKG